MNLDNALSQYCYQHNEFVLIKKQIVVGCCDFDGVHASERGFF